jgi:hypothetical protein
VAKAERDQVIRQSKDSLPRRRVAELTEMTPGRVQQIVDQGERLGTHASHRSSTSSANSSNARARRSVFLSSGRLTSRKP